MILGNFENDQKWSNLIKKLDFEKFWKVEKVEKIVEKCGSKMCQKLCQKSTPQKSALQTRYSVDPFFGLLMICISMVIDKLENSDILTPHIFDTISETDFRSTFLPRNFFKSAQIFFSTRFWDFQKMIKFSNFSRFFKFSNFFKNDDFQDFVHTITRAWIQMNGKKLDIDLHARD